MTIDRPDGPKSLHDRVAIITGASRGIGAATARAFVAAGAAVVLAARDEARLAALAEELCGAGGRAGGSKTRVRAAASSMASGSPSRRRQTAATAGALLVVSVKPGATPAARWAKSATAGERARLSTEQSPPARERPAARRETPARHVHPAPPGWSPVL